MMMMMMMMMMTTTTNDNKHHHHYHLSSGIPDWISQVTTSSLTQWSFWSTHWLSDVCTASHPSTSRPCANQSLRISTVAVYVRLHVEIWLLDGALRSSRLCYGWTVYMELLASVTARPVINTDILLSPTEHLSLQQSIRFISTLMTVILLLQRANVTTPYIHTLYGIKNTPKYFCA